MTVTPLPARPGTHPTAKRQTSKLAQLEAALNARIVERDAANAALAELTLKAGKAADQIIIEKRAVEEASTGLAERADDPAAMREFQDASFRLAAATAADEAFKNVVLPKARANLSEAAEVMEKAQRDVIREQRRLAIGPRIAAARKLVAAGQALVAAAKEWNDAGIAICRIDPESGGPSIELWRAAYAMPRELTEIFGPNFGQLVWTAGSPKTFVRNEIAAWGVGDPTEDTISA